MKSSLKCVIPSCSKEYSPISERNLCDCGNLLDVSYTEQVPEYYLKNLFNHRKSSPKCIFDKSGVWRFRELLPFALSDNDYETLFSSSSVLSSLDGREGQTLPIHLSKVADYVKMESGNFYLQFEGDNPSGSFKDNGMAAAFTHAKILGKNKVLCASTGNTLASMAAFSAYEGLEAISFIGAEKIAMGKLAQSLEYGARVIQIQGDFDDAMSRVQELSKSQGLYVMNSVNPFRLEGQKTIMYRALEGLGWKVPDWIVVPGGNLGNSSAFGKAFHELYHLGLISKMPRLAIINAEGANTLYKLVNEENLRWNSGFPNFEKINSFYKQMDEEQRKAKTIASAIEINRPVNLTKALRALEWTSGVVEQVSDKEMLDAKAIVGRNGFGCEPASAASVAGIKKLREKGIMNPSDLVVGILTGHQLKDPKATIEYHTNQNTFSNSPLTVENNADEIIRAIKN